MASIMVNCDKCCGCRLCIKSCPYGAIELKDKKAVISDNCLMCGACIGSCKFGAISLVDDDIDLVEGDKKLIDDKKHIDDQTASVDKSQATNNEHEGIMVFAEQKNSIPLKVVLELLGEGKRLANILNTRLTAFLIGYNVNEAANILIKYGADIVYIADSPDLTAYNDELYANIFTDGIKKYKPEIVLIGATTYGRSLAPRVAARLNTGLTADCTKLDIDLEKRLLLQTRPAFGGNLMATIMCPNNKPQMSTVRPNVFKPAIPDATHTGSIEKADINFSGDSVIKIKDIVDSLSDRVGLADADIVVAGGRGLGNPDNFSLIRELANVLGGAVGASRAVVDSGWIDYSFQIGQTGKTVCPKIYIACGISGAIQHIAGMSSSDTIIAINNNPDAPIFKIANYGIVGDVQQVLPALIQAIKQTKIT